MFFFEEIEVISSPFLAIGGNVTIKKEHLNQIGSNAHKNEIICLQLTEMTFRKHTLLYSRGFICVL